MPEQQTQQQPALTAAEVRSLTIFKWVYSLESAGFSPAEARRLVWARWAVRFGKLGVG